MPHCTPFYRGKGNNAGDVDDQIPANYPNAHHHYLV